MDNKLVSEENIKLNNIPIFQTNKMTSDFLFPLDMG